MTGPARRGAPGNPRSWRAAFEAGRTIAFDVDLASGAMRFSADVAALLGGRADTVEGLMHLVCEPDRAALVEALAGARRGAERFVVELRLGPPATIEWVELVGAPVRSRAGRIRRLQGVCFDITGRKRLEASLQHNEARFRDFAEVSSDWLWETDERHCFIRIIGGEFDLSAAIGKTRWEVAGGDPASPQWKQHIDDLEARRPFRSLEYPLPDPSGGGVYAVSVSGRPVFDASGGFRGYRGTTSDQTQRRALEAHLESLAKAETVGQIAGGIAHDFNNLLTIIAGNAEVLVEDLCDQPILSGRAGVVLGAARRGADLIHRLLTMGRRQSLEPAAIAVNAVVEGMVEMLRHVLGAHVTLRMDLAEPLPPAFVDAALLERAILNLVTNARDAMPRGGVLEMTTRAAAVAEHSIDLAPGNYVELSVIDTGVGIESDVLRQVLDPFFTTKAIGKGWGLGLSTASGFAKQSGGHLAISSQPGQGTSVRITLPQAGPGHTAAANAPGAVRLKPGRERILIVEDEDDVRRFAEVMLARLGYATAAVADGPAALARLRGGERFDLMFTDIVLPKHMSGLELAHEARKLQPDLRLLFTSAYSEEALERQGPRDPDFRLLRKPYLRHELAVTLRRALQSAASDSGA